MQIIIEVFPKSMLLAFIVAIVAVVVYKIVKNPPIKKLIAFFTANFLSVAYVVFACYILFNVTRYGIYGDTRPYYGNYIPFSTIASYVHRGNFIIFVTQIIGNILVILPLPFVIWFYSCKRKMKGICVVSLIITSIIEPLQLLINICLGGPSNIIDIDDLILNLVGCALGLLLLKVVRSTRKSMK